MLGLTLVYTAVGRRLQVVCSCNVHLLKSPGLIGRRKKNAVSQPRAYVELGLCPFSAKFIGHCKISQLV